MRSAVSVAGLFLLLPLAAQCADESPAGQELPLWELGVGAGALHTPDYPSSSESRVRAIALPTVVYRGDIWRLGDGQIAKAVAAENPRFELSLSFDAAFDASSDRNELRRGMPDLDFLFEAGPQLIWKAGDYEFEAGGRGELELALQGRAVFSTDFKGVDHQGYVIEPMLHYRQRGLFSPQLENRFTLRPVWADTDLHSYFYAVEPVFVTAQRPLYEASAGYFGTHFNWTASWHANDNLVIFGGIHILSQHGSANRNSPLFEDNISVNYGIGFNWSIVQSRKTVVRNNR
ncbi:MipA/OmpV family protein [Kineobactrum sediminis]|uniref:MipA/OmpV family protein n=1 Tax=Kineobactrum sediminis TaxID=1905677 RepID=A0A2N5XY14_9GAMM|nr:MipA/OmpV family protein [Kineobactrum sediminis]PLW81035.1 MipA/OmpV family protein [Kineobactrum sediminis]